MSLALIPLNNGGIWIPYFCELQRSAVWDPWQAWWVKHATVEDGGKRPLFLLNDAIASGVTTESWVLFHKFLIIAIIPTLREKKNCQFFIILKTTFFLMDLGNNIKSKKVFYLK